MHSLHSAYIEPRYLCGGPVACYNGAMNCWACAKSIERSPNLFYWSHVDPGTGAAFVCTRDDDIDQETPEGRKHAFLRLVVRVGPSAAHEQFPVSRKTTWGWRRKFPEFRELYERAVNEHARMVLAGKIKKIKKGAETRVAQIQQKDYLTRLAEQVRNTEDLRVPVDPGEVD